MSTTIRFKREEEEDEEGPGLMSAALYVEEAEEEEDEGRPPQDGMAYLRQVIKERKRVPDTVTVEYAGPAKTARLSGGAGPGGDREKAAAPPGWAPGSAWQRQQIAEFSSVRLRVAQHAEVARQTGQAGRGVHNVPDKRNEALWCHMMVGGQVWREVRHAREDSEDGSEARTEVTGEEPGLNFLVSVPVHVCEQVLQYLLAWLELTGWRSQYGPWLYALLVRLEKPLNPDVGSSLRDLVLLCARERKRLATSGEEDKEETIAALNLFICLVAKYFGQGDLEDREED